MAPVDTKAIAILQGHHKRAKEVAKVAGAALFLMGPRAISTRKNKPVLRPEQRHHMLDRRCCICGQSAHSQKKASAGSLLGRAKQAQKIGLRSHHLRLADVPGEAPLVWCTRCGCFGQHVLRNLCRHCTGVAAKNSNGDRLLKRIDSGWHPWRDVRLGSAGEAFWRQECRPGG